MEPTYFLRNRRESLWSLLYIAGLGLLFLAGFGGNAKPIQAQTSTGPTNISIGTTVQTPAVKRLGINMSGQSYYDSGIMMRNLTYANSGFEGQTWQSVLKCKVASGHTCADTDSYATWPANFMKGATFEFIYGQAKGQTGTVVSSTTNNYPAGNGPTYDFGTATPAAGDVFILRQANVPIVDASAGWWPSTGGNGAISTETTDLSPNTLGHQALVMNASSGSATETSYFDSYSGRSFVQMNGQFTVYFRAKSTAGSKSMSVSVQRLGTSHGNINYLSKTVTLTDSWQDYSYSFNASDDGTDIGTANLTFSISNGSMYLDDAYLEETPNADNPTAYRNAVVDRLRTLNPGVIRYMDNGADFGSTIDNLLLPEGGRVRSGFSQQQTAQNGVPVGIEDFLVLCQAVGAEPWFTMPAGMTPTEMTNLLEFLNGSASTTYGAKRAAYGQTAPWTSVFTSIHLELGNEVWNGRSFPGEAFGDPYSYGNRVSTIFGAAKGSANYVSGKIDLVVDGWGAVPWWTGVTLTAAGGNYDTVDAAPYTFNTLTDYSSNEAIFGPMFAQPEGVDSQSTGYMYQQMVTAATAAKPAKLAVYEVNLSTVSGTAGQSTLDSVVASTGAGISTAEHMLLMMRDDGIVTQNLFALPEYSNGFTNSNGGNENVKLWGSVVDMGGQSNLCRPQFLGEQLANTAIFGNLLATSQTGNNPTWTAVSANDNINVVGAHYIQSFAFQNGTEHSLVVFNLSRSKSLPVTFSGANAPSGTVQVGRLTSANLTDTNENSSVVSIANSSANINPSTGVTLPPFSMTVYTWGTTGTQPPSSSNTTTTLTASPTTVTVGGTVTLAATVAATSGSTPSGNVTFYDGGNSLGTTALASGKVTLSVSSLAAGSHSITAAYAGTSTDNASSSTPVLVTVNSSTPTAVSTTTALSAPSSVTQGSTATLTAKVTAASGSTPTGTVSFLIGQTILGTASLSGGTASFTGTVSLSPGQYSVIASYAGTSTDKASSSSASTVNVTQSVSSTSITLSAPTTKLVDGKSASVTATVAATSGVVPTGSVSFYVDSVLAGTVSLSSGKATLTTVVNMTPGTYQMTAKYAGDGIDKSSTSSALTFTVSTNTAVNLTSGATQVAEGSPVALTASVVPQTGTVAATGAVTFYLGQTALSSQQLVNGVASVSDQINLSPGQYQLTAVYTGDTDDNGATSNPLTLTVTAASQPVISTNTTLTASPTQLTQGQSIQLAAFVKAASGSTPTGTVSFYLGQTQLGSATLAAGSATASINATMAPGTYQLTAVYAGTSQDSASSSAPVLITIAPSVVATTTTLVSSASQLTQGQTFSLNATVATTNSTTPQGNVAFYLGQTQIGAGTLSGGQAVWTGVASFNPGTYQLTAIYAGNTQDTTSTSAPLSITVSVPVAVPPTPVNTSTMLAVNPAQVTVGQNLTLSVQVGEIGGNAIPTGAVAFFLGQTQIGSAILANGQAAFTTAASFDPGVYPVTAIYSGDSMDVTSTSTPVSLTVNAVSAPVTPPQSYNTTITLAANPQSITTGQNMTLAVQVGEEGGNAIPSGSVSFYIGQTQVGSAILANGTASLAMLAPAAGTYTLTATYSGAGQDLGSQSQPITLTVEAATNTQPIVPVPPSGSFTIGLSDSKISLVKNQSASLQVLLSAVQGYQGTVQLSCSGLPAGVNCNFSPAQVSLVAASANSMLSLSTSASTTARSAMVTNVTYAMQLPWGISSLFALFAGKKRSKYRFGTLAFLLLALSGGLVAMTGCGLTINSITQPYQVSVTAVGANQQSQTQSFTLYVTGPAAQF